MAVLDMELDVLALVHELLEGKDVEDACHGQELDKAYVVEQLDGGPVLRVTFPEGQVFDITIKRRN